MDKRTNAFQLSSASLHIIAMASMLLDHSLKTVIENDSWVLLLGRLAFPIFAFLAAEGFSHTGNFRKYLTRMLVFALLSEVPYDLMKSGTPVDTYDQNVIWTFLLALCCLWVIDRVKRRGKRLAYLLAAAGMTLAGFLLGTLFMVDYGGLGVVTVLVFALFPRRDWKCRLVQLGLMAVIHVVCLGAFGYGVALRVQGAVVELPLQGFALLALIPIWLYRGRRGYHSRPFQYFCYAFYPVHMLLLYLLSGLV